MESYQILVYTVCPSQPYLPDETDNIYIRSKNIKLVNMTIRGFDVIRGCHLKHGKINLTCCCDVYWTCFTDLDNEGCGCRAVVSAVRQ